MKKTTLSLTLLGAAFGAQAQISAGTTLLSGSAGYSRVQNKTESTFYDQDLKVHAFNITPTVGYFVAENLAVGANLDFTARTEKGTRYNNGYYLPYYPGNNLGNSMSYSVSNKTRVLSAGAFARYYKFVGDKAAFFGQAGGGYTNIYTNNASRQQGFYGNILPGFTFFPTDKFALELTLRGLTYNRVSTSKDGDEARYKANNLDLGIGLTDLRLGAAFYLGR